MQEKKSSFTIIPDDISIEEELINAAYVGVNFYGKSKFEYNAIHKPKNSADLIFSDYESKYKDHHCILDDDDDDDLYS